MTLSPIYSTSHIFKSSIAKSQTEAAHKVQLYLDYDCPFSAKIFNKLNDEIIPLIDSKHPGQFEFILMNVPQPWHPTSSIMHEVALAVGKVSPQSFWEYSKLLFLNQKQFYDEVTFDKSRKEIIKELIEIAQSNLDVDLVKLNKLLDIDTKGDVTNKGNKITKDLKYFIRYQRTVGVHVTPTVFVDGIENPSIESSTPASSVVEKLESYL